MASWLQRLTGMFVKDFNQSQIYTASCQFPSAWQPACKAQYHFLSINVSMVYVIASETGGLDIIFLRWSSITPKVKCCSSGNYANYIPVGYHPLPLATHSHIPLSIPLCVFKFKDFIARQHPSVLQCLLSHYKLYDLLYVTTLSWSNSNARLCHCDVAGMYSYKLSCDN